MAAFTDILARLETGLNLDPRLYCESIYRAQPMPRWLVEPYGDAWANARGRLPVLVINSKGTHPAESLVVMRLADLEVLSEAARTLERLAGPELTELLADRETRAAALADLEQTDARPNRPRP